MKLDSRSGGFTLLEVIVVIALLATVLALTQRVLTNVLETEKALTRNATPEKIGQGITALLRRDLMGVVYRDLGERVFQVIDNGEGPSARDELQLFTTVPVLQPEAVAGQLDAAEEAQNQALFYNERGSVTAVHWFLQPSSLDSAGQIFTLFRLENVDYDPLSPFESGGGVAYEVYDKVRGFSVEVFDGYEWWPYFDSQQRLRDQAEQEMAAEAAETGVSTPTTAGAAVTDPAAMEEDPLLMLEEQLRPPAAIPVAVRLQVTFLAGDEKGVYVEEGSRTGEFKEFTYTTIVPIIAALRVPLTLEEETGEEGGLLDTGDGTGDDSPAGAGGAGGAGSGRSGGGRSGDSGRAGGGGRGGSR